MEAPSSKSTLVRHFKGHKSRITQLSFHPTSNQVASSSADSSVMVWNCDQTARCLRFSTHTKRVNSVCWSPKSDLIASASSDRTVKIWLPRIRDSAVGEIVAHTAAVRAVDFDNVGHHVSN